MGVKETQVCGRKKTLELLILTKQLLVPQWASSHKPICCVWDVVKGGGQVSRAHTSSLDCSWKQLCWRILPIPSLTIPSLVCFCPITVMSGNRLFHCKSALFAPANVQCACKWRSVSTVNHPNLQSLWIKKTAFYQIWHAQKYFKADWKLSKQYKIHCGCKCRLMTPGWLPALSALSSDPCATSCLSESILALNIHTHRWIISRLYTKANELFLFWCNFKI